LEIHSQTREDDDGGEAAVGLLALGLDELDLVQRIGGQQRAQPAQQDALPQPTGRSLHPRQVERGHHGVGHDRPGENLSGAGPPHAGQGRTLFDSHRGQPHDQRFRSRRYTRRRSPAPARRHRPR